MSVPPELLQPEGSFDARPVVEWLLRFARDQGASDLHLRPTPEGVEVLLRQDSVLYQRASLPLAVYDRLLVGLKNMARLASYRKSTPQDGRMLIDGLDVRVATAPSLFGEKVIARLVRGESGLRGLDELGLDALELTAVQDVVSQPQGLVLVTGPAGSGKTTTLFAALRWLYDRHLDALGARLNVVTLEDPIELVVSAFTQTQIQDEAGMSFAEGLRSILRQDPDVILVGEIRDAETARAAVQASLTGHLVLSTIHARDSVGTVPRLLEMGVEPYLLSAALAGVIYQRLLRRLCPECQGGCPACGGTGYRGRTAVAEVMRLDTAMRQAVLDRCDLARLRQLAEAAGMRPLQRAAATRVAEGITSEAEARRIIPGA